MDYKTSFKAKDKVAVFGCEGVVVYSNDSYVDVEFNINGTIYGTRFLPDGRLNEWHGWPSLRLLERPKQKKED